MQEFITNFTTGKPALIDPVLALLRTDLHRELGIKGETPDAVVFQFIRNEPNYVLYKVKVKKLLTQNLFHCCWQPAIEMAASPVVPEVEDLVNLALIKYA